MNDRQKYSITIDGIVYEIIPKEQLEDNPINTEEE